MPSPEEGFLNPSQGEQQDSVRKEIVTSEYREALLDPRLDFAQPREGEDTEAINSLSDHERTDAGLENIRGIIKQLLDDDNGKVAQGTFWNAHLSKDIPFVLKTERPVDGEGKRAAQIETFLQYEKVKREVSREFLPTQVVLRAEGSEKFVVLQERVDEHNMLGVSEEAIADLTKGKALPDIQESLQGDANKATVRKFAQELRSLWENQGLMLDINKDNVFLGIDENGKLTIKVPDYGCYDKKWEARNKKWLQKNVKKRLQIVSALERLAR